MQINISHNCFSLQFIALHDQSFILCLYFNKSINLLINCRLSTKLRIQTTS